MSSMRAFSRTSAMSSSRIRPAGHARSLRRAAHGPRAAPPHGVQHAGRLTLRVVRPAPRDRQGWRDEPPRQHAGTPPDAEPTLGALVHDLTTQIPELVRSEIRLAQAEMTEKGKRAGIGIGLFSAAGLLAFFGLATLIATADARADRGRRLARCPARRRLVLFAAPPCSRSAARSRCSEATPRRARTGGRGRQGGHRHGEGTAPMSTTHGPTRPTRRRSRPRSRRSASSSPRPWTSSPPSSTSRPAPSEGQRAEGPGDHRQRQAPTRGARRSGVAAGDGAGPGLVAAPHDEHRPRRRDSTADAKTAPPPEATRQARRPRTT